jgi:hypothetical protein
MKWWTGKNMEGNSHSLYQGSSLEFVWRDWEKTRKHSVRIPGLQISIWTWVLPDIKQKCLPLGCNIKWWLTIPLLIAKAARATSFQHMWWVSWWDLGWKCIEEWECIKKLKKNQLLQFLRCTQGHESDMYCFFRTSTDCLILSWMACRFTCLQNKTKTMF